MVITNITYRNVKLVEILPARGWLDAAQQEPPGGKRWRLVGGEREEMREK